MWGSEPSIVPRAPSARHYPVQLSHKSFDLLVRNSQELHFSFIGEALPLQTRLSEFDTLTAHAEGDISESGNTNRCLPKLLVLRIGDRFLDPLQTRDDPFWCVDVVLVSYGAKQEVELRLKFSAQKLSAVHYVAPVKQFTPPVFEAEKKNCCRSSTCCCPTTQSANPVAEAVLFASDAPLCLRKCVSGQKVRAETARKAAERRKYRRAVVMLPHGRVHNTRSGLLARAC